MIHNRITNTILSFTLLSNFLTIANAKPPEELTESDRKMILYIGDAPCNMGEVTTYKQHKGCDTKQLGYTIDDASAIPASDYIEIFSGNDVENNKMVSKDSHTKGGSTESIGYLSKKPIPGGVKIYSGEEACNMGEATTSTKHKGCNAGFLGYALPLDK